MVQGARALAGGASARLYCRPEAGGPAAARRGRRHHALAQYEPDLRPLRSRARIEQRATRAPRSARAPGLESGLCGLWPVRVLSAATVAREPISLLPVLR